jgi:anti-sigma factor ChrR (cupin superfamily)
MADDSVDLVMCAACEERVAELIAEGGRSVCSVCMLEEIDSNSKRDETDD